MKFFVLAFLLAVCVIENEASRDWRFDVKMNHMEQVNSIVNSALNRIQNGVKSKACYEAARLSLRSISQNAYSQISSCVSSANTAGDANVCCQQVDSSVFNQGLDVSREATACDKNA